MLRTPTAARTQQRHHQCCAKDRRLTSSIYNATSMFVSGTQPHTIALAVYLCGVVANAALLYIAFASTSLMCTATGGTCAHFDGVYARSVSCSVRSTWHARVAVFE